MLEQLAMDHLDAHFSNIASELADLKSGMGEGLGGGSMDTLERIAELEGQNGEMRGELKGAKAEAKRLRYELEASKEELSSTQEILNSQDHEGVGELLAIKTQNDHYKKEVT